MNQANFDYLELEHITGYNGKFLRTIIFDPVKRGYFIYCIGGLVVIQNIDDPHDQKFLRGHDMAISSLAISSSGNLIASGQLGTIYAKNPDAPIILWDSQNLKPIQVFKGIQGGVRILEFSPDERFLAATGQNNVFVIWNTYDFCVVYNRILESPVTLIAWGEVKTQGKHPQYTLITCIQSTIFLNSLEFDLATMNYTLKSSPFQLPSSGLIRNYTKCLIDDTNTYLFAGTTGGEICIFNIANRVFKAALPVSNNGVQSIAYTENTLFVGSGDGRLKKLSGKDSKWGIQAEILLDGGLVSLSLDIDKQELIAGSNAGKLYRVLCSNLNTLELVEGHIDSVNDISFKKDSIDIFATIDSAGIIRVWDINTLQIITRATVGTGTKSKGLCICIADDSSVVSGWEDGFIRAYDISNKKYSALRWEIANAHRGGCTSIHADANYILSGGEDGIVRVWSRKSKTLVTQISIHRKTVVKTFPDLLKPHIIHSCSIDKTIHSYDLKTEKKVILHQAKNGIILDMSQRRDHEYELVTCGSNVPILFWDCDVIEPVEQIEFPQKLQCIDISPSGKYMAVGSENSEVLVFKVENKAYMGRYIGHSGAITKLKWAPDEKQIISASNDASLCVWNFYPE